MENSQIPWLSHGSPSQLGLCPGVRFPANALRPVALLTHPQSYSTGFSCSPAPQSAQVLINPQGPPGADLVSSPGSHRSSGTEPCLSLLAVFAPRHVGTCPPTILHFYLFHVLLLQGLHSSLPVHLHCNRHSAGLGEGLSLPFDELGLHNAGAVPAMDHLGLQTSLQHIGNGLIVYPNRVTFQRSSTKRVRGAPLAGEREGRGCALRLPVFSGLPATLSTALHPSLRPVGVGVQIRPPQRGWRSMRMLL